MSANDVRTVVSAAVPNYPEMGQFLAARVKELQDLGLASNVPSQKDLIPVLAADMARDSGGDAAQYMAAAAQQINGNNTTALTSSNDRYTGIEGGLKFDELHELIHICSAPGGKSVLHNWKLQLNEGAINVFALLTAPVAGVKEADRYTDETRIVKKLLKMIASDGKEKEGYATLYEMTFVGLESETHITDFFKLVGNAYIRKIEITKEGKKINVRPDGKTPKTGPESRWTANEAGDEFQSKVRNWNLKWLEDRLPAL